MESSPEPSPLKYDRFLFCDVTELTRGFFYSLNVRKRFRTKTILYNGLNPIYDQEPFVFNKVAVFFLNFVLNLRRHEWILTQLPLTGCVAGIGLFTHRRL